MAEARASHAALVERSAALASEVVRLEQAARELESRFDAPTAEKAAKKAGRPGGDEDEAADKAREAVKKAAAESAEAAKKKAGDTP